MKNSAEPFEGSKFYPIAEPSLAEPFFKFRRARKVLYFSDETFLALQNFKKRFCKGEFCYQVKLRTFKGFCRIFHPFFETLDASGCFYFSAEPFWLVRSTIFFIFREGKPRYLDLKFCPNIALVATRMS